MSHIENNGNEKIQENHLIEEQLVEKILDQDTPRRNIPNEQGLQPKKLFPKRRKEKIDFKERNRIHKIIKNIEEMDVEFLLINTLTITA